MTRRSVWSFAGAIALLLGIFAGTVGPGNFGLGLGLGSEGSGDRPELHPTTLILEPASPIQQGLLVNVTAKLENTGTRAASAFQIEFFLRPRIEPEGEGSAVSWTSFALVERDGLAPEEQEIEVTGVLDTSNRALVPEPGVYEIRVLVDSNDQIPELDETNNELIASLRVEPSKLGQPDLRPTRLIFEPPSPVTQNDMVLVQAQVENTGDADAAPFDVAFSYCLLPEGRTVCPGEFTEFARQRLVGGLPRGASQGLAANLVLPELGLPPGQYLIKVTVDPTTPERPAGQIDEQDEANNELIASLFVQGPELFPTSLSFSPALPHVGDLIKVAVTVKNAGLGPARDVEVAFFLDGAQFARPTVTVNQDEEVLVEGTLNTDALGLDVGIHLLRVVVDPDNRIAERDETNNEIRSALTLQPRVPRRAELHPKKLLIDPSSPIEIGPDRRLNVLAEVVNTGEVEARDFEIAFFYRGAGRVRWVPIPCATTCTISSLAPGAGATAQGTLLLTDLAPGNYEVRVVADPDGRIPELDETNNEMRSSFTLLAPRLPDLILDPISVLIEPSLQVPRGTALTISFAVENVGERDAEGFAAEVTLRRLDEEAFTPVARFELPGLALGERRELQALLNTAPLRPGFYELRIVVDPEDRIREADERNNVFSTGANPQVSAPLFIRGPDLAVLSIRYADPRLTPISPIVTQGEPVEVIAQIFNIGIAAAGAFDVQFCYREVGQASCSPFGARTRFPGLAADPEIFVEARAVLDTSVLAPGSFEVVAIVDPAEAGRPFGRVEEEIEENNTAVLPLGILPRPDLRVERIVIDPPSPVPQGAMITVFADIRNEGDGPIVRPLEVEFALRPVLPEDEPPAEFEPFARATIATLDPGTQAAAKVELDTSAMPAGTYELRVTVDPERAIPELNEGNNALSIAFELLGEEGAVAGELPDLVVTRLTIDPEEARVGETVTVRATVRNQGRRDAGAFRVVFFYRRQGDDRLVNFANFRLGGLASGAEQTLRAELDTSIVWRGRFEILVVVDINDEVQESNEENNEARGTLRVR